MFKYSGTSTRYLENSSYHQWPVIWGVAAHKSFLLTLVILNNSVWIENYAPDDENGLQLTKESGGKGLIDRTLYLFFLAICGNVGTWYAPMFSVLMCSFAFAGDMYRMDFQFLLPDHLAVMIVNWKRPLRQKARGSVFQRRKRYVFVIASWERLLHMFSWTLMDWFTIWFSGTIRRGPS